MPLLLNFQRRILRHRVGKFMTSFFLKTFPVGPFQCNCSIVADRETGEAIIVDPGDEADKIIGEVQSHGFDVKYLVHTHAHIDHVAATKEVHEKLGGEICLHQGDIPLYENLAIQAQFLGWSHGDTEVLPVARLIEHHDMIEASPHLRSQVLFTPGHTPGSVCFSLRQKASDNHPALSLLFSGDTLFKGSIGRTDLWGGDHGQILSSIKEELLTLDSETIVIPGHGPQTSIGSEKQANPFLEP